MGVAPVASKTTSSPGRAAISRLSHFDPLMDAAWNQLQNTNMSMASRSTEARLAKGVASHPSLSASQWAYFSVCPVWEQ